MADSHEDATHHSEKHFGSWTLLTGVENRFLIGDGEPPADEDVLDWSCELVDAVMNTVMYSYSLDRRRREDFNVKYLIAKFRQLESEFDTSSPFNEVERRAVACAARLATPVRMSENRRNGWIRIPIVLAAVVSIIGVSQFVASWWLGASASLVTYGVCGLASILSLGAAEWIYDGALTRRETAFTTFPGLLLILSVLGVGCYSAVELHNDNPGFWYQIALGAVLCSLGLAGLTYPLTTAIEAIRITPNRRDVDVPIDILIVLLIEACAEISKHRNNAGDGRGGDTRSTLRVVLFKLEKVAHAAEYRFAVLAPAGHGELHDWYLNAGRSIGTTIRLHKRLVVDPNSREIDVALRSLANGIALLARREWQSLMIAEPESKRPRIWRLLLPRIALATTLLTAAIVSPWLIQRFLPSAQVDYVRATLVVSAIFSLVVPDVGKARDALMQIVAKNDGHSS